MNLTRDWVREQTRCRKVAKNSRASVNDLSMAINSMQRFEETSAAGASGV